jgi:hypothetical protein
MEPPQPPGYWKIAEVIGIWLSGLATFSAVLLSLKLAREEGRSRVKVRAAAMDVVPGDGTPARTPAC